MFTDTQVVVFASQKGGSGKTTLAGHVAIQAQRSGAGPIGLIDTDPQASLAQWHAARVADVPTLLKSTPEEIANEISRLRDLGTRLVFIDTPPAASRAICETVRFADLVVVPTRPSPHDLRAVGATVDIVEQFAKPLVFVVNSGTARARITSEAAVALSQHGTVAPVTIHHRVDFAASMIDGRTVMEHDPSSRSAAEIGQLWEYLLQRLQKLRAAGVSTEETVAQHPAFGGALWRHAPAFGRRAVAG